MGTMLDINVYVMLFLRAMDSLKHNNFACEYEVQA
jgi:hypothetical protein